VVAAFALASGVLPASETVNFLPALFNVSDITEDL